MHGQSLRLCHLLTNAIFKLGGRESRHEEIMIMMMIVLSSVLLFL